MTKQIQKSKNTPDHRLREAHRPGFWRTSPASLGTPFQMGLLAGYDLAFVAHISDGQPISRDILNWWSPIFQTRDEYVAVPSASLSHGLLGATRVPKLTKVRVDVTNDQRRKSLVNVLLEPLAMYGYEELRDFARGFYEAISATRASHSTSTLVDYVLVKHPKEIARLINRRSSDSDIARFVLSKLPSAFAEHLRPPLPPSRKYPSREERKKVRTQQRQFTRFTNTLRRQLERRGFRLPARKRGRPSKF